MGLRWRGEGTKGPDKGVDGGTKQRDLYPLRACEIAEAQPASPVKWWP